MSYGLLKKSIILFMISYTFASFYITYEDREIFPFFSWNMFNKVPPDIAEAYDVLIHKADTETFTPPKSINEVKNIYRPNAGGAALYRSIIGKFGLSLKDNNVKEASRRRAMLESKFLLHPVEYEVVHIRFNTIERFKTGRTLKLVSLGKFSSL